MLKLIDGLEAISRNRDLAATCRQFLAKYAKTKSAKDVAGRLAYTLDKLNEKVGAAKAYQMLWEMEPGVGTRQQAAHAIQRFATSGKRQDIVQAAELAEQVFAKLPTDSYSLALAVHAGIQWERISEWAKANLVIKKTLVHSKQLDQAIVRSLHKRMSDNYARQGQNANAVTSLRLAQQMKPDQATHAMLIDRMYQASAKVAELKPVVDDYLKRYPTAKDHYYRLGQLAYTHQRDNDKLRAKELFAKIMRYEAATHNALVIMFR